jgi:hypothetical protein
MAGTNATRPTSFYLSLYGSRLLGLGYVFLYAILNKSMVTLLDFIGSYFSRVTSLG